MTFALCACGNKHKVEWQGHYLYIDDEKYIYTGGLYNESNTKVGKSNGFTIYEVVGDKELNYVVSRSFLDQHLYVKESYTPDKTTINVVCFSGYIDDCLYDEKIIDCMSSLESDGEFIGYIFTLDNQYMYYNYN